MSDALLTWHDVPLQSAYLNGYYDILVFLKNMFSTAFSKTNDALEKNYIDKVV